MGTAPYEFTSGPDGETVHIRVRGRAVLSLPMINQGTAFRHATRDALGISGLLPPGVTSMNAQLKKVYEQYREQPTPLAKNNYLEAMHDRNEVLYYRLLAEHLEEMLPIVYTPTIGEAIEKYSQWMQRPRGVFLSIEHPEQISEALASYGHGPDDLDLIVVTDSEGILGIGDQGVGGVRITVGKLAIYTAAAGIHPQRVLPVVLDVGTNNLALLNEETYLGVRHSRVRGERYDAFVREFMETAVQMFPHAMIHFEDFGASNAHRVLETYRHDYCAFNDDIQGTAAVVVAAVLSALSAHGEVLADQRIVVHGAGTAGIGITDLLRDMMVADGLTPLEANKRFWGLGSKGLLREGLAGRMRPFQEPYARSEAELAGWQLDAPGHYELADVVRNVHPTVLIGTSAQSGAFTEEIIRDMAAHTERPIIMPLSNPTVKAEAVPADLLEWTGGRALIATGSPFGPVEYEGVSYTIAQANNALVFPGIGLAVVASHATRVSDGMIAASARAVASLGRSKEQGASLLPGIQELRAVSATVAVAVAAVAEAEGLAERHLSDPIQDIYESMWAPAYPKVVAD
ncbi:malate dehydrogenase (oxaloacetate-decarboxylating) [Raineyella antarctica]|uniref:Putative malate oxidoreductase [NAD] n=1 Tax=Raineyella antarctica TaxID=1577474 RepID=A0A1G6H185_9ACTN|nr:NAD-dependent malic enzyme [Raineyella antarctica]SDB88070.1 malate dehydrogenase (oxaloacetate-decarboxylating) [Raineyella antarctica]